MEPLLGVRDLCVCVSERRRIVELVKNVSFDVNPGECLGILGESGSGKSLVCKSLIRLLADRYSVRGEVRFGGRDMLKTKEDELRLLRGNEICMILQNPMSAFDPLCTIGAQMTETIRAHKNVAASAASAMAAEALERVSIGDPARVLKLYPHQLSGGMLQRVMIGLTLVAEPGLIIADEPTTALDTVTQHEVLQEISRLRERSGCAMVFVTHDLGVLSRVADTLLVMHAGEVAEQGPLSRVYSAPESAQARYLLESRKALIQRFRSSAQNVREAGRNAAASF